MPKRTKANQRLANQVREFHRLRSLDPKSTLDGKSTPAIRTRPHPETFYDSGDIVRIIDKPKWKTRKAKVLFSVNNPGSAKSSSYYRVQMLRTGEIRTFGGINLRAHKLVNPGRKRPSYVFLGPHSIGESGQVIYALKGEPNLLGTVVNTFNISGNFPPYVEKEVDL